MLPQIAAEALSPTDAALAPSRAMNRTSLFWANR